MYEALCGALKNTASWGPLVIRVALGVIFMAHGSQKLFGWFDGPKVSGTVGFMESLGVPAPLLSAWVVAIVEFFGGLAIFLGFFTGAASLLIIANMLVAIVTVHGPKGFFSSGGGCEYNIALIAMALSLIFTGPGALALSRLLPWR